MPFKILLLILLSLLCYKKVIAQTYTRDLNALFQKCKQTRLDSAHRLIVSFLRKHEVSFVRKKEVIQTPKKFYKFCDEFREICNQNQHQALLRRLKIIALIDKLKYQKATLPTVEKAFYKLFDELVEAQDYSAALSCLLELGLIQGVYNQNLQAIKILFFAEKFAEKHHLLKDVAMQSVLKTIGYYLWEFDISALSIQYFKKSLETTFSLRDDSLIVLNGIGINYQKLHDFKQSNQYFQAGARFAQHIGNHLFGIIIKGNIAVNLFKTGNLDQAYAYAEQDKNASLEEKIWENAVGAMYWLVQIELKRNNFAHAKILLDSLDAVVGKTNDKRFVAQRRQKEATYFYYQALKNTEKSLLAYQEFVRYDSLFQAYANKNKISELKLMADVQLYTQEMENKNKEKQLISILFGLTIIVLLLIIAGLAWHFYRKVKKAEQNNLRQAQEIKTLKQQLFEQIADINQQNTGLKDVIIHATLENEHETLEFDTEKLEVKKEDIQFLRNFNLTQKEQWKAFKTSFLKVYPMFEQDLATKMDTISQAELRLMMLHKLGLNSHEIRKTLLISAESVRTGKYRLYKKLGISSAEELNKML